VILAAVVLLRRHLHPALGLLAAVVLIVALWPVLAVAGLTDRAQREPVAPRRSER
jgi:hypothetical protein